MKRLLQYFKLGSEKENDRDVVLSISKDIPTRGANLWLLIFAILVASLGLNVNSTAVIIGAMLISPLMGPIMGLGLGMAINDIAMLRRSLSSYLVAAGVSLATSTLYFSITPLNAAHSEILARTAPNIYDVLIAFFGGLAGSIGAAQRHKGNVIPGVAIATALMPPLCTAGYGLATWQTAYFFGAFYLFLINSVFIALATLVVVRLLKFPYKKQPDHDTQVRARHIAWWVVVLTLLPSLYFGYEIVVQEKFRKNAEKFIRQEANFQNDYLLEKTVDAAKSSIILTYGGKKITEPEIAILKSKLANYGLGKATVTIRQGFAYLSETIKSAKPDAIKQALAEQDNELLALKNTIDSLREAEENIGQLAAEAKALYPDLRQMACTPLRSSGGVTSGNASKNYLVYLQFSKSPGRKERNQIREWLETRLHRTVEVVIAP